MTVREIQLSRGLVTVVDEADYEWLNRWKWHAWSRDPTYAIRNDWNHGDQRTFKMHRVILGAPAGVLVDHRNSDTLDNRRSNLRLATQAQNAQNMRPQSRSTHGLKGVHFDKITGRWRAQIKADGIRYHLGRFDSQEDAARAYDQAALEHWGEFAWLNFGKATV